MLECPSDRLQARSGPKKSKRSKGSKTGSELERLVQSWLQLAGWKTHRAAAAGLFRLPGGRAFTRSNDLFGCFDLLAHKRTEEELDKHGNVYVPQETWAIQTTAPTGRDARRKKIQAAGPWPVSWRVSLLIHKSARLGRQTKHWFMIEDLVNGSWTTEQPVEVDVKTLEAHRSAASAAKKARSVRGP